MIGKNLPTGNRVILPFEVIRKSEKSNKSKTKTIAFAEADSTERTNDSRVRIKMDSSATWVIGNIEDIRADSIYFGNGIGKFPIKSISKFEISRGQEWKTKQGGKIGLLLGGISGAIAFAAIASGPDGFVGTAEELGVGAAISMTAIGGLTGLAVGSFIKTDQWQTINVEDIGLKYIHENSPIVSTPGEGKTKDLRWSISGFRSKTNSDQASETEVAYLANGSSFVETSLLVSPMFVLTRCLIIQCYPEP